MPDHGHPNLLIIHCIDYRIQKSINDWLENHHYTFGSYDRVSYAGGVFDTDTILRQVEISYKLHQIRKVILLNHQDCGAYGKNGTFERHRIDLHVAKYIIKILFPGLEVESYYIHIPRDSDPLHSSIVTV